MYQQRTLLLCLTEVINEPYVYVLGVFSALPPFHYQRVSLLRAAYIAKKWVCRIRFRSYAEMGPYRIVNIAPGVWTSPGAPHNTPFQEYIPIC